MTIVATRLSYCGAAEIVISTRGLVANGAGPAFDLCYYGHGVSRVLASAFYSPPPSALWRRVPAAMNLGTLATNTAAEAEANSGPWWSLKMGIYEVTGTSALRGWHRGIWPPKLAGFPHSLTNRHAYISTTPEIYNLHIFCTCLLCTSHFISRPANDERVDVPRFAGYLYKHLPEYLSQVPTTTSGFFFF